MGDGKAGGTSFCEDGDKEGRSWLLEVAFFTESKCFYF